MYGQSRTFLLLAKLFASSRGSLGLAPTTITGMLLSLRSKPWAFNLENPCIPLVYRLRVRDRAQKQPRVRGCAATRVWGLAPGGKDRDAEQGRPGATSQQRLDRHFYVDRVNAIAQRIQGLK